MFGLPFSVYFPWIIAIAVLLVTIYVGIFKWKD